MGTFAEEATAVVQTAMAIWVQVYIPLQIQRINLT